MICIFSTLTRVLPVAWSSPKKSLKWYVSASIISFGPSMVLWPIAMEWMLFHRCRTLTESWQNLVFASPCFDHFIIDICLYKSSSMQRRWSKLEVSRFSWIVACDWPLQLPQWARRPLKSWIWLARFSLESLAHLLKPAWSLHNTCIIRHLKEDAFTFVIASRLLSFNLPKTLPHRATLLLSCPNCIQTFCMFFIGGWVNNPKDTWISCGCTHKECSISQSCGGWSLWRFVCQKLLILRFWQ